MIPAPLADAQLVAGEIRLVIEALGRQQPALNLYGYCGATIDLEARRTEDGWRLEIMPPSPTRPRPLPSDDWMAAVVDALPDCRELAYENFGDVIGVTAEVRA